jgi:hypothetical protein
VSGTCLMQAMIFNSHTTLKEVMSNESPDSLLF